MMCCSVVAMGTRSISKLRREGPLSLMSEHREALWTNYTPAAKPDTSILNRLVDSSSGISSGSVGGGAGFPGSLLGSAGVGMGNGDTLAMINNEILRRHFVEVRHATVLQHDSTAVCQCYSSTVLHDCSFRVLQYYSLTVLQFYQYC